MVTALIFGFVLFSGWRFDLRGHRGWHFLSAGFGLLFLGSILDITDNFEHLNRFVVIGDTHVEAFLEKVIGYLLGFILLAAGFWYWLPLVSELKQTEARLKHAKKRAEQASQAKSEFLATMSHEIRTPMNGVLGMLRLLLASGLTGRQWELAQTAQTSAEDLLTILNDILDFSKLEAGRFELEYVSFNPNQLLHSVVSLFRPRADAKELDLSVEITTEIPQWVYHRIL